MNPLNFMYAHMNKKEGRLESEGYRDGIKMKGDKTGMASQIKNCSL